MGMDIRDTKKEEDCDLSFDCWKDIQYHLDDDDFKTRVNEKSALFMIRKVDGEYSIMTGNFIPSENVEMMKGRLDRINEMDKDQLKLYYKEVLNNGEMSAKGGGGLGMIDIARKSGKKLEYDFDSIDNEYSFFSLNIKVAQ